LWEKSGMLCRKLLVHNEINSYFINVRREGFFSKIRMAELDGCGLAC
jgi:hypothetical protein